MTNGHHIPPDPEVELRNVLQGITGHLEVADPTLTRLTVPREHLELWGYRIASAILLMDVQAEGVPAVGWGIATVATIALLLVGLWLWRHC